MRLFIAILVEMVAEACEKVASALDELFHHALVAQFPSLSSLVSNILALVWLKSDDK